MDKTRKIIALYKEFHIEITTIQTENNYIDFLKGLVDIIRPKNNNEQVTIRPLLQLLSIDVAFKTYFLEILTSVFNQKNFISMLTDVGIPYDVGLKKEFTYLIMDLFLPEGSKSNTVTYIFNQLFYEKNDAKWIENVNHDELIELFQIIKVSLFDKENINTNFQKQLFDALSILTLRASGKVLERHILHLSIEYQTKKSPFELLYNKMLKLNDEISESGDKSIRKLIYKCKKFILNISRNSRKKGISLRTNKDINRLRAQVERIEMTYNLLYSQLNENSQNVDLFLTLIAIHFKKVSFKSMIAHSTHLIASEVLWYKAKTGEKYVTETKQEYWEMLKAAAGGGFIVGLLVIIKLFISKLPLSTFGFAFLYSTNYAIGFVLIYLMGFTLATKQPAMTGTYMVRLLKKDMNDENGQTSFAVFFARLFRSQFIAFVGNVIIAFPVAILGVYLLSLIDIHVPLEKTVLMLKDLNPLISLALLHATIAGVYLFISGLVAGNTANKSRFYAIPNRIASLAFLKNMIGTKKTLNLAKWYKKKWPGVMSNLYFGVFMGVTAPLGIFIGLNIDIRHITFAAGNFGISFFGADFTLDSYTYLITILGITLIGIINFSVSFGLALLFAIRAKNIPAKEIVSVIRCILIEFKNKPLSFFYPTE